ncbi:MAG: YlbF family regulator [Gemmatimonadota bacterium]
MVIDPTDRERIFEKASEVGRLLSQTPEYAYLKAAHREIGSDREATEMLNRMRDLQERILGALDRGEEPARELRDELADLSEKVQRSVRYQSLISAQANFDKLMDKVHEAIGKGIKTGEESRIILPT